MFKKTVALGAIMAVVAVAITATIVSRNMSQTAAIEPSGFPAGKTIGVWSWQAPDTTTLATKQQDAKVLKQQGVTEVYIDISGYNDYDELPSGSDRTAKIQTFTRGLHDEVSALSAVGIKAQALAGDTRWANPDYQYIPLKLLAFAQNYNAAASPTQRLTGMQFDIEFYSAHDFTDAATQNTLDYLSLTKQLIQKRSQLFSGDPSFALGFAVPDSLDGSNAPYMPNVSLNGAKKQPPLPYLLSQLKGSTNAYIVVMAYRNHTDGTDGTIARAQTEMTEAQAMGIKMLVGEETTNIAPAKLTFYSKNKSALKQSTLNINTAFGGNSSFGGFAINDQQGYLALKD
jgi:hypothetical protein